MIYNPEIWQRKKLRDQCRKCYGKHSNGESWCWQYSSFEKAFFALKGHDCGNFRKERKLE